MAEQSISGRYQQTRQESLRACSLLSVDDYGLQAEPFTSPPKWHLAHTTWFFETFLLKPFLAGYQSLNENYQVLFNSYYNGVGEQFPRARRGLLSRPGVDDIMAYRRYVDAAMMTLLEDRQHLQRQDILARTRLGVEHEQQHQELFYTDIKYSLFMNPLLPSYSGTTLRIAEEKQPPAQAAGTTWREFEGGFYAAGVDPDAAAESYFSFDNEGPQHRVYLEPFALADRLVTNGEYQAFIDAGGYERPELWLSDGWTTVQENAWAMPLYWIDEGTGQFQFTLDGLQPRDPDQPVCHLSGYESDAYACWLGLRLPTEFEWEFAATRQPFEAPEFSANKLHPTSARGDQVLLQLYSECWQWTGSAYRPYRGFAPSSGAIGEYNGKFMANQWVLRGGSSVSSTGHVRPSYRNFFYPQDRWQFTGLRLARDL